MDYLDDLVRAVTARLRASNTDGVFAAWPDGSVSAEDPGFTGRLQRNGTISQPLAIFEALEKIDKAVLRGRLEEAMRARGLLPPL
jgi:hypothetical protein